MHGFRLGCNFERMAGLQVQRHNKQFCTSIADVNVRLRIIEDKGMPGMSSISVILYCSGICAQIWCESVTTTVTTHLC